LLIVGYANRRKIPMQSERKTVVTIKNGLCHFSGTVILLSTHSTIFIAGKAIKTSITTENTRVKTILSMIYIP